MKRKEKGITILGLSVLICSLFLVAIPATAIAAEQDDYVLGVYGNANEDDTIDMRDLTYVKLIFFGKKPETELADAKYDGKINPLDFIQTKLIILGKEKELTVVDFSDRIVTVKKPVQRIVFAYRKSIELAQIIKVEKDRIVGVDSFIQRGEQKMLFPEYQDIPTVTSNDPESIMRLNPDVVFLREIGYWGGHDECTAVLELAGITVIREWYGGGIGVKDNWPTLAKRWGYLFDKQDEAEEYCDFLNKYMNPIKETVKEIPEEDKPKVYFEYGRYTIPKTMQYGGFAIAGGKDLFADEYGEDHGSIKVDPEAVIARDPEIIVSRGLNWEAKGAGYGVDAGDTAGLEEMRDEIMSRPELQNVKAVKDGRVYIVTDYIQYSGPGTGCRGFLGAIYMAKWFHPELFKDIDPKAMHQEYLTDFLEVDIDLDEKGVFVYPEPI